MKIGIVGHLKFPIAAPFSGGLESFTHSYVRALRDRGHEVKLFASGDSDDTLPLAPIIDRATIPDSQRRLGRVDNAWIEAAEDEAYGALICELGRSQFDVVHNHSLSPIPLRFAGSMPTPLVTTLHSPVIPRMRDEIAVRSHEGCGRFVNISRFNALRWRSLLPSQSVVHNGVDVRVWKASCQPKQGRAIWFGRILPDKGTHHAIDAAHLAGLPIDIVGPISDVDYFDHEIMPRLRSNDVFHGHQDHQRLCGLISQASIAIVTPCWDEPFGLVVTEALACGTPVVGFARGCFPRSSANLSDGWSRRAIREHSRKRFRVVFRLTEMLVANTSIDDSVLNEWCFATRQSMRRW